MEIKTAFQKPYIFWMGGIFLSYITLVVIVSQFYITIKYIPYFLTTLNWFSLLLSSSFTLLIGFLISVNMVSSFLYYQNYKKQKKTLTASAVTGVGTLAGLSTGVCSACVATALPFVSSLFGITVSFASLPFRGLEIQLLIIMLLSTNLYYLSRKQMGGSKK